VIADSSAEASPAGMRLLLTQRLTTTRPTVHAGIRQVDFADSRRIPSLVLQGFIFSEIRLYPPHAFGVAIAIS
jgi:hypothetical protein